MLQGREHLVRAIAVQAEIVGAIALSQFLVDAKRQRLVIRQTLTEGEGVAEERVAFRRSPIATLRRRRDPQAVRTYGVGGVVEKLALERQRLRHDAFW